MHAISTSRSRRTGAQVLRSPDPIPCQLSAPSVFLAGSIDLGVAHDWQAALIEDLSELDLVLLNPRRDAWDHTWKAEASFPPFREQVEWELHGMEVADRIAFYFAPDSKAPITLLELGLAARQNKALVCCPPGYWRKGNVDVVCAHYGIPLLETLDELSSAIREFAERQTGEPQQVVAVMEN